MPLIGQRTNHRLKVLPRCSYPFRFFPTAVTASPNYKFAFVHINCLDIVCLQELWLRAVPAPSNCKTYSSV